MWYCDQGTCTDTLSVRHWLISLTVDAVLQMINFYLSPLNFSVVLWSRYTYMPVRCKAFCWGILSVRHWLISFRWMQCFKWLVTVFFCLALRYSDQGICRLGAKLFAEESFLLGIDWSVYNRCIVSNEQLVCLFVFFCFAVLWSRYMPVRCEAFCWGILSIRHWLIILQYMQCFKWSVSFFLCSAVLWSRYMPVRCEAFCWGILSIRHWLIILQYMQCFKWSIRFFLCPAVLWSRYMPVRCEAFCWGILSIRHWLIILQ